MRVINKDVPQNVIENGYDKFTYNFWKKLARTLLFPLTIYYSKKYQKQFWEFCFTYPRVGKIPTEDGGEIEYHSFENHYYDVVKKDLTKHGYPIKWENENYQEFVLKNNDGKNISCLTVMQKKLTDKWVIGLHGWTENKFLALRLVTLFYKMGYNVLTFDNYAHGKTYGDYSDTGINSANDLPIIIDYLKQKHGAKVIGMVGNSMGASTINYYLLNNDDGHQISWAIPDCGFISLLVQFRFVMQYRFKKPWWLMDHNLLKSHRELTKSNIFDYDLLQKTATNYKTPILLIHGKGDDFVPFFHANVVHQKQLENKNPYYDYLFLDKINHIETLFKAHDAYEAKIKEFIKKHEKPIN
ncbi:alpha/beta hydrolase [Candidatus Mycoplasma pogonae]